MLFGGYSVSKRDNNDTDKQNIKIIYCEEGPELVKIVTDSFLIYLKTAESTKKAENKATHKTEREN